MCNTLNYQLSSAVPGGTENIAGLWFASGGISTQADTMEHYDREYEIKRTRSY